MIHMLRAVRDLIMKAAYQKPEDKHILSFTASIQHDVGRRALDVGCGYGSKMEKLAAAGWDVLGVEVDDAALTTVKEKGFKCANPDEFKKIAGDFDLILMSHVIEHFDSDGLIAFMETYLDRLKQNGYLVIATPLLTRQFFDDPDHVRPYYPGSLLMIYGDAGHQTRLRSRQRLTLIDLWFRRQPWSINWSRGTSLKKGITTARTVNILLAVLFLATFGIAGRVTGWVGLFKKV